jgi:osmotically-inducible protein OsmY
MNILRRPGEAASSLRSAADGATGRGSGPWGVLLAAGTGVGLGAAAAYLLDPDRGRGRRARLADQAAAGARRLAHRAGQIGRLQAGRLEGVAEELLHRGDARPILNDASLAKKVETELFRSRGVPKGAINVNVEDGVVVLRGEVGDESLRDRLEGLAGKVEGVEAVRNLLHLPGEPATAVR